MAPVSTNTLSWLGEPDYALARYRAFLKHARNPSSNTAAKQRQNVLDYDDLLLYWAEMMKKDDLAAEIGGRFDHILDTNRLQSKILLRLKPDGHGLMVVGDEAQSIYSFRAATVRNILDFPKQFRATADIITLEQNYRKPSLPCQITNLKLSGPRGALHRADKRANEKLSISNGV